MHPKILIDIMSNNLLYWEVPKEIDFNIYQDILVHFNDLLQICSIQMVNKNEEDDQPEVHTVIIQFLVYI